MKIEKEIDIQINENRIKQLEKIFPEVVTDGIVDFDKLKEFFNKEQPENEDSKFGLQWFGKKNAEFISKTPSQGTLRPCIEESKNWDKTGNLYIEGDNLEVLKLLQKSYANKVDVIYIDPPYNTGNDFVYKDDFKDSLKEYKKMTNQVNEENQNYSTNKEGTGRYHSNWLSMMYPRLKLARNLLKEDGVIFISIDDNEQARLKLLCDEIFGESNFVANINWQSSFGGKNDTKLIPVNTEYILCYSQSKQFEKNIEKQGQLFNYVDDNESELGKFNIQPLCRASLQWHEKLDFIIYVQKLNDSFSISFSKSEKTIGIIVAGPSKLSIEEKLSLRERRLKGTHNTNDWCFYWSKEVIQSAFDAGFVHIMEINGQFFIYQKAYAKAKYSGRRKTIEYYDTSKMSLRNVINDSKITSKAGNDEINYLFSEKNFDYPKPTLLINKLLSVKNNNALILDFFSGSASTSHSIINSNYQDGGNRKFIMVQIPQKIENENFENICEIGKERIRRAGDLILKENKESKEPKDLSNLDIGFRVLKLDTSNIKEFEFDEKSNQSSLFENNILEDRNPLDLLFETIIKLGFTLDKEMKEYNFNSNTIYSFNEGTLMACFDQNITIETIKEVIKIKEELNPPIWKAVFLDNGFDSDKTKINAKELIRSSISEDNKQNNKQDIDKVFNTI